MFPFFFFLLKTQPRRLSLVYGKSRRDVKKFIGRLRISGHNCVRCYAWRKRAQPAGKRKSRETTFPLRGRTRFFNFSTVSLTLSPAVTPLSKSLSTAFRSQNLGHKASVRKVVPRCLVTRESQAKPKGEPWDSPVSCFTIPSACLNSRAWSTVFSPRH